MSNYYFILFIIFIVSLFVQNKFRSKFNYYSKLRLGNDMSGKEIAEKMLVENGIRDVVVTSVPGQLTDYYDPINRTVNLSEDVYMQRNVAAAAVAAHECGHAIQHSKGYSMLRLRSKLVPIVNLSSRLLQFVMFAGIVVMASSGNKTLFTLGVGLFMITTIFAFITLPVEYDASNRALKWLEKSGTVTVEEKSYVEDSLKWAAKTYVVAALGSLAQLLYFLSMLSGGRRD